MVMEWLSLPNLLQTIVGLGLLNVWLVRGRSSTSYRGGAAQTLQEEFATCALKIGAVAMHIKVGDPAMKSLPAALMLVMSAAIVALR